MSEPNQSPEAIIEQIKRAFPNKFPGKGKLKITRSIDPYPYYKKQLHEVFEGKRWEEVISHPKLIYCLSEVDALRTITHEAYFYYLPAYLIAILLHPEQWIFYSYPLSMIQDLISKFSLEEVEILISFLDYLVKIAYPDNYLAGHRLAELEDAQLRFMLRRDELQSSAGNSNPS